MQNVPLHPMVVHIPLALALLLPFAIAGAFIAIRTGSRVRRAWAIPLVMAAGLASSAFVALRTGAAEEERVEDVVGENVLHEHEEAAERLLWFAGLLVVIATTGLLAGKVGQAARIAMMIGSIGVALAAVQVGKAGGELVYREGAADAYTSPTQGESDDRK